MMSHGRLDDYIGRHGWAEAFFNRQRDGSSWTKWIRGGIDEDLKRGVGGRRKREKGN